MLQIALYVIRLLNFYFFPIAVSAAVYTERLFKSGSVGAHEDRPADTFLDQQFWLYLYGTVVASAIHLSGDPSYFVGSFISDFTNMSIFFKVN